MVGLPLQLLLFGYVNFCKRNIIQINNIENLHWSQVDQA